MTCSERNVSWYLNLTSLSCAHISLPSFLKCSQVLKEKCSNLPALPSYSRKPLPIRVFMWETGHEATQCITYWYWNAIQRWIERSVKTWLCVVDTLLWGVFVVPAYCCNMCYCWFSMYFMMKRRQLRNNLVFNLIIPYVFGG